MSSTNSNQSGHSPLKDALEGRRRHCEEHGELFESTPVSSTADWHHEYARRSLSEASFKLKIPQNIEEESGAIDHNHEDSPVDSEIAQHVAEEGIESDRSESSKRLGFVDELEGTNGATREIDIEQVREHNTKSASSSSATPKARDRDTCARDPLRPWIESMEDYFRALPPAQSRDRLRISNEQQRNHNTNNHRLSFCNGVEVQRNTDDTRRSPPLEEWRRSSWDEFLVFTDGRQANRQNNGASNGTGASSSSTPSFRKRSDDSDDRYSARDRKRRSSAERKHSDETSEVKGISASARGKRDVEHRLREASAKSIYRGERQRPPYSPPRRRQPHHRACACNAFDALLGD